MDDLESLTSKVEELLEAKLFNDAAELLTDEILEKYNDGYLYYANGFASAQLQQTDRAIDLYSHALHLNFHNPAILYLRGKSWFRQGAVDKAIEDYTHAIEMDSQRAEFFFSRGLANDKIGKYDSAIDDYTKAIELDPNDHQAFCNRAITLNHKKEYEKAIEDCTRALMIDSEHFNSWGTRGIAFFELLQFENALHDFNKAISIDPSSWIVWCNIGVVWARKAVIEGSAHYFKKAIPYFEKAIELNSENGRPFYYYYDSLKALGFHQQATANLHRAYFLGHRDKLMIRIFSGIYPSPYILEELLHEVLNVENIVDYENVVLSVTRQNNRLNLLLDYAALFKKIPQLSVAVLKLNMIVNYYMGHPARSFAICDKLEEEDLRLRDQYYFALSAERILEPDAGILHFGRKQIETQPPQSPEEWFYAGQIYVQSRQYAEAVDCFKNAGEFLPAMYGMIGIYKYQKEFDEITRLSAEISRIENMPGKMHLINGITPLTLHQDLSIDDFVDEFSRRLFYYELQNEIAEVRARANPVLVFRHIEFHEMIIWDPHFEEFVSSRIGERNARALEKMLVGSYKEKASGVSLVAIKKAISNNNEAKSIISQAEDYSRLFENTFEKEMALSIRELKQPADWYLLVIDYFYLTGKLSARQVFILHYYTLKIGCAKKNKAVIDTFTGELKFLLSLINPTLKSPLLFKALTAAWVNLIDVKGDSSIDQYKDYQQFKKRFRTDFYSWWKDDLYTKELMEKYTARVNANPS